MEYDEMNEKREIEKEGAKKKYGRRGAEGGRTEVVLIIPQGLDKSFYRNHDVTLLAKRSGHQVFRFMEGKGQSCRWEVSLLPDTVPTLCSRLSVFSAFCFLMLINSSDLRMRLGLSSVLLLNIIPASVHQDGEETFQQADED
ncbi:unnamed protein product [Leuciscus chuanchicus]